MSTWQSRPTASSTCGTDALLTKAGSGVDPTPAIAPAAAAADSDRLRRGTRLWFAFFLAWMIGLAVTAVLCLDRYEQTGDGTALRVWILLLMCFYLSLCNSFLPLPTIWIVLLAAMPEYAVVPDKWANVALVAALSTLATIVANLNEYHLLAYLLRFGLGRRIRRTRLYGWSVRWFDRAPFQLLTLIAFVPLPVDTVRWLAILRGYSRKRFALAYLAGRGPRYVLFAGCSLLFTLTPRQILIIQLVVLGLALAGRLAWYIVRRVQRGSQAAAPAADETTLADAAGPLPNERERRTP